MFHPDQTAGNKYSCTAAFSTPRARPNIGTKRCGVLNAAVPCCGYPKYGQIWPKNDKNSRKNEEFGLYVASIGV